MTASVHSLLRKHGILPKKRLGQHFLSPIPTIQKIVAALEIEPGDAVIEIGPGLGIMTAMIAERARLVIAVERDRALLQIAREELAEKKNIVWIEGDILKQGIDGIADVAGLSAVKRFKLIGNLPYNISSPILFWMLDARHRLSHAIVMLQKEVVARIVASPGNKDYGILSVLTQAFAGVRRLFDVSAKSFVPPPEVTSSVMHIDFTARPRVEASLEPRFKVIVRAAFGRRRKTIRNALLGARGLGLSAENLDKALKHARIELRRRPETLSVEEFAELAKEL